jgi:hypothetical protein
MRLHCTLVWRGFVRTCTLHTASHQIACAQHDRDIFTRPKAGDTVCVTPGTIHQSMCHASCLHPLLTRQNHGHQHL